MAYFNSVAKSIQGDLKDRGVLPSGAAVHNMMIRTTLIVDYPVETEAIFKSWKTGFETCVLNECCFTYSHEENTHAFNLEDDVPEEVKKQLANAIMELQSQISLELNQEKIGKSLKC